MLFAAQRGARRAARSSAAGPGCVFDGTDDVRRFAVRADHRPTLPKRSTAGRLAVGDRRIAAAHGPCARYRPHQLLKSVPPAGREPERALDERERSRQRHHHRSRHRRAHRRRVAGEGPPEGGRPGAAHGVCRKKPAAACSPCWRDWDWYPSAITPRPLPACSSCPWSAPRMRRSCRPKAWRSPPNS